jgi:hypothetical protein
MQTPSPSTGQDGIVFMLIYVYKFDKDMKSVPPASDQQTATCSQVHMKGLFLE